MNFKVSNIKIAFTCNSEELRARQSVKCKVKHYSNFSVLKLTFTYIIFWSSGYINVTKLKTKKDISSARIEIEELFKIKLHEKFDIHNIFSSGQINLHIHSLYWIYKNIEVNSKKVLYLSFYPDLRIMCRKGTIIIFQSGKVTILGCKSFENLSELYSKCASIQTQLSPLKTKLSVKIVDS